MPKGKRKPYDGLRPPSLRGVVVVADVNGTPRFSKWPRPPGKNRNPVNVQWTNWLKAVTYLYRYQPAKVQALFQRATANTPWMPRDPFISGVRGRAWSITDEDGRTWYPMPARQAVSQSLDAITQLAGKMLIRGATGWEATDPPSGGAPLEAWIPPSLNPFSTNGRWAGVKCTMGETVTLEALAWQGTISGSSTYGALVAEVDASNVITAVTLSPQRSGLASPHHRQQENPLARVHHAPHPRQRHHLRAHGRPTVPERRNPDAWPRGAGHRRPLPVPLGGRGGQPALRPRHRDTHHR